MIKVRVAEIAWERSVERNKLRYVTVVSDGDSKAYNKICDLAPYRETVIEKEECLNHSALAKKETPRPHKVHIHTPLNKKLQHSHQSQPDEEMSVGCHPECQ
ncbi:hypothetical protein RRG08_008220 [Elysia crispata]|uniref:Mutator-like transposase domain-containing protein n=1 Tax=Elysia crispata TaxID=231223 RepID=A0AAE1CVK8_9GAST|nr:hypothetical protein RRG08_008220 [Elysia crispata]